MTVSRHKFFNRWSTLRADIEFGDGYLICREFYSDEDRTGRCKALIRTKVLSTFGELPISLYVADDHEHSRAFVSESHIEVCEGNIDISSACLSTAIHIVLNLPCVD